MTRGRRHKTKVKVLQINTNRRLVAHDLALATAKELGAGVIAVCEPNKNAVKDQADWICDDDLDTAIKILDQSLPVLGQGKGKGFAYVTTPALIIFNCYASPNQEIGELEDTLEGIGTRLSQDRTNAIIIGDFNAKSPQWGMHTTDARGNTVVEWIAQCDLYVRNEGTTPTFEREGYGSILDLTLSSAGLAGRIPQWEVCERESLSDHNYIVFTVSDTTPPPSSRKRASGWNIQKIDRDMMSRAIERIVESPHSTSAGGFTETLTKVCKACMPRKKSVKWGPPAYWWSPEIADFRKSCIQARRNYTRCGKRNDPVQRRYWWDTLSERKKRLQRAIRTSKRNSWKELCDEVDKDVWGKGYQITKKRLMGNPHTSAMTMKTVEVVATHLFPEHEGVDFLRRIPVQVEPFTAEELQAACRKMRNKKAPGPIGIPPEIVKEVAAGRPQYVLKVYNGLASKCQFPDEWKRAKLVLLRKGQKPAEEPSSYRPICLLDAEGKLYEHLILARMKKEIERTGGLAENQYGFREGRQTLDAIKRVMESATRAASRPRHNRPLCAAIMLDVKNAFNSASWKTILDALRNREMDENLIGLIASYLSGRAIILEAEGKTVTKRVTSGVPQGSVLGPILWNVQYDGLLRMELPEGVEIAGFADDVAIIVTARSERLLMDAADITTHRVGEWMTSRSLELAPEKTEAIVLTNKRKVGQIMFNVQGVEIQPTKALKYLGVWLDQKMTFSRHIAETTQKAEKTMTALARLMPNIRGPRSSKRRILVSVVHSQLLYAAPIWLEALNREDLRRKMTRVQKIMGIRVCSGYRTISAEGVGVIAGIPPIELLAKERQEVYAGRQSREARDDLLRRWQEKWAAGKHGRWTHSLIPDLMTWIGRSHGEVDYFLAQALSGHGCFRQYLHVRDKSSSDECFYCTQVDDAKHALFKCPRWQTYRDSFREETGQSFDARTMMTHLLSSEEGWARAYATIRSIVENKEREMRLLNRRDLRELRDPPDRQNLRGNRQHPQGDN